MRAVVLTSAESTSPELVDLPLPEPQAGEVRVRVAAASVNGFDLSVPPATPRRIWSTGIR